MKVLEVRNVNSALPLGVRILLDAGIEEESRNGPVIVFPSPVTTVYNKPTERVMLHAERDANPFFHLYESIWMLAGCNDVESVGFFAKNMHSYSDDGETLHGAYGHRWRERFHVDQLACLVTELKKNPQSRRCVLQMWDSSIDLNNFTGKDVPCNTHAYFWIREGMLHMTVTCRSNDIVWGAYGANAVHFSVLLEYMARHVDVKVGRLYQVSNNYHIYKNTEAFKKAVLVAEGDPFGTKMVDHYKYRLVPYPMFSTEACIKHADKDIQKLVSEVRMALPMGSHPFPDPEHYTGFFFQTIIVPMMRAFMLHKVGSPYKAIMNELDYMPLDSDWRYACVQWINRRHKEISGTTTGRSSQ